MKLISELIQFTPVDDKGPVSGVYYLDQLGNIYSTVSPRALSLVKLPYVAYSECHDDILEIHASELELYLKKLTNLKQTPEIKGMIKAFNLLLSYQSSIDPWSDFMSQYSYLDEEFIDSIEEDI